MFHWNSWEYQEVSGKGQFKALYVVLTPCGLFFAAARNNDQRSRRNQHWNNSQRVSGIFLILVVKLGEIQTSLQVLSVSVALFVQYRPELYTDIGTFMLKYYYAHVTKLIDGNVLCFSTNDRGFTRSQCSFKFHFLLYRR